MQNRPKFNINDAKDMSIPDLLKNEGFKGWYALLYDQIHPRARVNGTTHYEQQITFFRKFYAESEDIRQATATSVATLFIDLAYYAMTIEPMNKALAYVMPRSVNIGTKENKKWEKRVLLQISPYGELALRLDSKVIRAIQGPFLVHQGDSIETVNGMVHHIGRNQSTKITGGWIRIIRWDGVQDDRYFSMEQIMNYRSKSKDPGSFAWTGGIDGQPTRGMIEAKVIKHGFDTYPRLNLSATSELASDEEDTFTKEAILANTMAEMSGGSESPGSGDDSYREEEPETTQTHEEEEPKPTTKAEVVRRTPQTTKSADESNVPTFF